jgi:thioesterase domain-containing protein
MRRGGDEVPLFCFPAIGGGLGDFAELVEALAAGRPVWAAPAFGQSDDAHRIEAAASRRADAILDLVPHGPIHLLGWSYGALVAFETARRLAAAGREIGALVLVDAPAPTGAPIPDAPAIPGAEDVLPPDVSPADAADWRAGVDARRAAIDRYRPAAFDGDVTVVRGTESIAGRSRGADLGWSALVRGDLRVEWAPGSHDSILTGEGARAVASLIERIIPTPPHREHS